MRLYQVLGTEIPMGEGGKEKKEQAAAHAVSTSSQSIGKNSRPKRMVSGTLKCIPPSL